MKSSPPAIVLGTELPRATAIVRSLGKADVNVIAFDHRERMPGAFSRYIGQREIKRHNPGGENDKVGSQSNWFFSVDQALSRLQRLGEQQGGVLIPTNDDYTVLVSKNHAQLSHRFICSVPPWNLMEPFLNKQSSQTLAQGAGVTVPDWFAPKDIAQGVSVLNSLDFDHSAYIFKLDPWSKGPCDPVSGAMTRPAGASAAAAVSIYREVAERVALPMIQEVIPGDASVCIGVTMLIDIEGTVRLAFCIHRLLLQTYATGGEQIHPYELGANIYAESCHDDDAIEAAKAIMKNTGYYGVVTVEFRRRQSDGKLFFIKIDPRFVNSTAISQAIGIDLPKALYAILTGGQIDVPKSYPTDVGWIWLDRSVRTILRNRGRMPIKQQVAAIWSRRRSIRSFAYFDRRDLKPCWRAWTMEMRWQLAQRKKRLSDSLQ